MIKMTMVLILVMKIFIPPSCTNNDYDDDDNDLAAMMMVMIIFALLPKLFSAPTELATQTPQLQIKARRDQLDRKWSQNVNSIKFNTPAVILLNV